MITSPRWAVAGVGAVLLALACGPSNPPPAPAPPDRTATAEERALDSEREAFIAEASARLDELDSHVAQLEAKIQDDSPLVEPKQRAVFSQELFKRKQEQNELRVQLQDAREGTAEEWQASRVEIQRTLERMRVAMSELRADILAAFSGRTQPETNVAADSGLCPLDMPGANAEVQRQNDAIVVRVSVEDEAQRAELSQMAQEFARSRSYLPATEQRVPGPSPSFAVSMMARETPRGVEIAIEPASPDELDTLMGQLREDAALLGKGRCETAGMRTGMRW